MSGVEVIENEVPAETLDLVVTEKAVGFLNTNIAQLELLVDKRLEDYKPENYMGDADLAKKDRAELNKASEQIKRSRINLINELMKPYQDFEDRCKALEKKIAKASASLDEIVKVKEQEEKDGKKHKIELQWLTKNFDLVPLDKIFNPKWLNKTYKFNDIDSEMDEAIKKIYSELKLIDRFADDAETLKAHYLINLDIGETMDYGEELQKQREVAKREAEGRAEREHTEKIEQQKEELEQERIEQNQNKSVESLVDEALGRETKKERREYVISVKCFDDEILQIKEILNSLEIEFGCEELTF